MRGNRLKLQVRVGNQGQRTAAEKQAAVDQLLFCPGGLRTLGTLARQQLSGGGSEENRVGGERWRKGGVSISNVRMSSSPWTIPTGWSSSEDSSLANIHPSSVCPSLVRPTFHHPSLPPILRSILPSSFHQLSIIHPSIHPSSIHHHPLIALTHRHCRLRWSQSAAGCVAVLSHQDEVAGFSRSSAVTILDFRLRCDILKEYRFSIRFSILGTTGGSRKLTAISSTGGGRSR